MLLLLKFSKTNALSFVLSEPKALKNSLKGNNLQLEEVCVIFFQWLKSTYKM